MKKLISSYRINFKSTAAIGVLGMLLGCASQLKPVPFSASADPTEEILNQRLMMDQAKADQVDVLASENYQEAKDYLSKASKEDKKGDANKDVLKTLGYSKAHLELATREAATALVRVEEVTKSRAQAIAAGAHGFPDQLKDFDEDLKDMAVKPSDKVSPEDKVALQTKYLALELSAIKRHKIGKIQKTLDHAKEKNAETITPQAYKDAVGKFNIAEKVIDTDRHSNIQIDNAAREASVAANRVMSLLASVKTSKNQTPEERAVTLESRDQAINKAKSDTFAVQVDSMKKDQQLAEQDAVLAISEDENSEHKRKEFDDKVVANAAAQFNSSEADVYRQDGILIIRLKSMNFASGRSDLPSNSIAILTKVKDILKNINAKDVMVEGHTDGVGPANINQQLSEKRAESVVKFFENDEQLSSNKLDSVGFGYSKPLATNKTKAGRAQNRRVDILVKTNETL